MSETKSQQLKKVLGDQELREHALSTLQSLHHAVEEARSSEQTNSKKARRQMKKDKKKACIEKLEAKAENLKQIEDAVPAAGDVAKKKRHPVRKLLIVATLGTIVALIVSEDARKAALDALFGAEEEFQYTSKTASPVASSNGAS